WRQRDRCAVPRIAFINKMDRVGADFHHAVATMHDRLSAKSAVAIQIPLGAEARTEDVMYLAEMRAYRYRDETLGAKYEVEDVPADLLEEASHHRDEMI